MASYGEKVRQALLAVQQMHTDTSNLLQHCNGALAGKKKSVFGNYATRDLTYHVQTKKWMAEGAYRYWDWTSEAPGLVEGVMVDFGFSEGGGPEPTLICGRLQYKMEPKHKSLKGICGEWDLWNRFYAIEQSQRIYRQPLKIQPHQLILSGLVFAIPLYELTARDQIVGLMKTVRDSFQPVEVASESK